VLVRFPHPSGGRGKKRPTVVVQSDVYNTSLRTLVVAEVTTNLTLASDPACLLIDVVTPEGAATGLLQNSVVSCLLMATVRADNVDQVSCSRAGGKRRFPKTETDGQVGRMGSLVTGHAGPFPLSAARSRVGPAFSISRHSAAAAAGR
jgi:mRNA-degrading endonuclease toxin of MazEF toxin-antitoxin module